MRNTLARRALAALAASTAPLAFAAPARADDRLPLGAGATAQARATPGSDFTAPLSVTNTGTRPIEGVAVSFFGIDGFATENRPENCTYDVFGELDSCVFDRTLEPGRSYRVDLPLRAPADAYAPSAMRTQFTWEKKANHRPYGTPGDQAPVPLLDDVTPEDVGVYPWQFLDLAIIGRQSADLVATGSKVYGAAGDVVQLKAVVRNDGPATLKWIGTGVPHGLVVVTIPPGTSVRSAPSRCAPATDAQRTRTDAVQYACVLDGHLKIGKDYAVSLPFSLRIDEAIREAAGLVEVNPACTCERFADDLDKTNDTAPLIINPAPTTPGGTDTNPPSVTATGLTEGQLLGRYNEITPSWSDDVAVTKVQVLVNGRVTATHENPLPGEVGFVMPADVHEQEPQITIRAFDAAGNTGEKTTRVRADVLRPDATLTPASGSRIHGVVTFQATNVSSDTARIELLGTGERVVASTTAAPWTMTWDTRGLNGGQHLSVRVFDHAGNGTFDVGTYDVDNSGPSVSSITPDDRALVRGSVRTTAKASDPSGIRSVRVTGGKATSSPWAWTVSPKAQGAHTIEWVVIDNLGNTTFARRVVVNDTVAPALKLTKAPKNNAKLTKNTTLAVSASDRNGVAKVQLLVNGKVVATDTKAGYSFTLNPKKYGKKFTVQLRAYDKAGNVTTLGNRTYRR
ncbi:Ig-like domain-containing protein [Actinoplanes sp. NPDC023801]|uniref:Ig-like domain-containing protein n=1 Tax=Actinoplanes sp. NPDC023801 TaxID=3154595 RepID=UPI0033CC50E4